MCNTSDCLSETLCIQKESNMKAKDEILNSNGEQNVLKNTSFKQVYEFPVLLCRRGSKDLITWINTLKSNKKTPLEIAQHFFEQIQSVFLFILVCVATLTIILEVCTCLILFSRVMTDPGLIFLFSTCIFISYLTLRIFTGKKLNVTKEKVKSKEI